MGGGLTARQPARVLTTAAVVGLAVTAGGVAAWMGTGTLAGAVWPALALAALVGVARTTTA